MKTVIGVFFGGKSVEHEVSIISAHQVINAIDKEKYDVMPIYITKENRFYQSDLLLKIDTFKDLKNLENKCNEVYFTHENSQMIVNKVKGAFKKVLGKIDIVFPVVHGLNVEDGTLQGFLEMYNIPYVGCDVCASASGMNKIMFKKILESSGLPVIEYSEIYASDFEEDENKVLENVKSKLSYPMILKPANLGSSVGIKIVKSDDEFFDGVRFVLEFTDKILVERCVTDIREINSAVLGDSSETMVSVLEEPVKKDEFLSFEDKYMSESGSSKGSKTSSGMASLSRKIPADLDDEKTKYIQELSKKVFKILDCAGVARIDYIIDGENDKIYVNEINTIPGSISFYLWEPLGIKFDMLCEKLIKLAIKRAEKREKIIYSNSVNLLSMHGKK